MDVSLLLLVLLVIIVYLFASIKIVRQGYNYTIEYFGRFTTTALPGLNFYPAFLYRVGRKINMMEQVLDAPKAAYEVNDLYNAILNLVTTNLRTVMGSMDLDETLSKRDEINARLLTVIDDATTPWGIKITRVEIKDIRPPQDIVNAMARQMKAEREKRANILDAEGARASEILRSEGEKQGQILQAEGRKESAFLDAEAREREAQAEAKATQMVSEAIASGNAQAINYFVAQDYVKAVEKFATSPNAKTILFPVEATQLIGSLGGIGALAKEALGEDGHAITPPPRRKGPFDNQDG